MSGPVPLTAVAAVARRDGLAAGLTAAFDLREPVACSRQGRTLVPPGLLPVVGSWSIGGVTYPAARCRVEIEPSALARLEQLVRIRVIPATVDPAGPSSGGPPARGPAALAAVRAGLDRRLLGGAIDTLARRVSDGAPLTDRQLVRAEIAEIAVVLETVESALSAGMTPAQASLWHDELDRADQALARLVGGAGYLDDHPVRALRLVALLRDVAAPAGERLAA
ncbi:hypothetical protein [Nakamurella sp.]|uniref:hypothetical protein n=1 Tax=Nakamurella sp. TaxID=1869182 RepID=UPI003B3A3745